MQYSSPMSRECCGRWSGRSLARRSLRWPGRSIARNVFRARAGSEARSWGCSASPRRRSTAAAGLGLTEMCIVGEELRPSASPPRPRCSTRPTWSCAGWSATAATSSAGAAARPIDGSLIGCLAMTEPEAGSDVMSMRTRATSVDGGWRLNGDKTFITNGAGRGPRAGLRPDRRAGRRSSGCSRSDRPARLRARQKFCKMGWRGSPTGELVLDDCEVGARPDRRRGRRPRDPVRRARQRAGADGCRVGRSRQGALEVAVPTPRERRQFGRPIGEFQLIQGKLADMYAETEAPRGRDPRGGAGGSRRRAEEIARCPRPAS